MFLGAPVYGALFIGSLLIMFLLGKSFSMFTTSLFYSVDSFTLLAIPLFIFAGEVMGKGQMARHLISFANSFVGRMRSGLAHVVVLACLFFGTLSGSGFATVAAIGSIMVPEMEKHGWDRTYSTTMIVISGFLGWMIPPSIGAILYGVLANVSVAAVFLSTVIPGILVGVGYMIINYFIGEKWHHPISPLPGKRKMVDAIKEVGGTGFLALPAICTPLVILGGIYGGIFSPTEAAAVASLYAVIADAIFYRSVNTKTIYEALLKTGVTTITILILIAFATPITKFLLTEGVARSMATFIVDIAHGNALVVILIVDILILILGMFISDIAILIIIVPLLLPTLIPLGVNPIHAGAFILLNCGIGTFSPPFGNYLFFGSQVGDAPYSEVAPRVLPFMFFCAVPVLILTSYIPQLSLWLPSLVLGSQVVYGH